jgi:CheY-like chemotaxis protein
MNILVIEDDLFIRKVISHNFLEQGYTVSTAGNGQEAIEMVQKNKAIDVILVDLLMPKLTGPSFLLMLKKHFHGNFPKIIVVSGVREGEEFLMKLKTDYDYYVPKPIDFKRLNTIVKELELKTNSR